MNLGQLIKRLEKEPLSKPVKHGFGTGDSYRGYYDRIAFMPLQDTDIHYMLLQAKQSLGATYTGYKGGRYKMTADTPVHIAYCGDCRDGDELTKEKLEHMLGFN